MAERPVFIPLLTGKTLTHEVPVAFAWHKGMAASQKRKNIASLHHSAALEGLKPLLEISSKSEVELGRKLSSFEQKVWVNGQPTSVECAFQGSKVFEHGGPFVDLYCVDSRSAKRDERLKNSGRLIGFSFEGEEFPLFPTTVFYDWLYINALYANRNDLSELEAFFGFTDIEFNPARSLNCQARSCATFVALEKRGILDDGVESFGAFLAATGNKAI